MKTKIMADFQICISVPLRGIMPKHHSDFCYLNCLHSYATENKRESHIVISFEDTKILEFNQCQKSDEAPFIIYVDVACLMGKIDGCKNNPENSSTTRVGEHVPSGFLKSTV